MVRYKRTVFTNPSIDNGKVLHTDEPRVEHSVSYVLGPTDVKERYGLYNVQTPQEKISRKYLRRKDDSARPNYQHYSDSSNLEFSLPTTETYLLKPKRHTQYENMHPGNTTERRFINHTGLYDFEQAIEANYQSRRSKMNFVGGRNIYEMVDPSIQNMTVQKVTARQRGDADCFFESIQELEMINKNDPFSFKSHDSNIHNINNIHRLPQEQFPTTETALKVVNVDDNLSTLTGRGNSNEILYKRNFRLLSKANDLSINNEEGRGLDGEKPVNIDNKGEIIHDFPKIDDFNSPQTLRSVTEPDYANFAQTPLRLLQRPTRAKRMHLHKPELVVIPEIGTFNKSENIDFTRRNMLLSMSPSSKNPMYVHINKGGREEISEVESRTNFQNKMKSDNKSLSSINSNLMYTNGNTQNQFGNADMSRLTNTRLHSDLLRDKVKKWSRHRLPDTGPQSYRVKDDYKMKSKTSAQNQLGYYYNY